MTGPEQVKPSARAKPKRLGLWGLIKLWYLIRALRKLSQRERGTP